MFSDMQACTSLDVDIITFDLSKRLPFRLKPALLQAAVKRGLHLEICYAAALREEGSRRSCFANALGKESSRKGILHITIMQEADTRLDNFSPTTGSGESCTSPRVTFGM